MSTQQFNVALGSPVVMAAGDNTDFCAAAGAAGTVTLDASVDGVNFFGGQTSGIGGCVALNTRTLGLGAFAKVRATSAIGAGTLFVSDIGAPFRAGGTRTNVICQTSVAIATPNSVIESQAFKLRLPAGYLKPNFSLQIDALFGSTNSATVKTVNLYFGNTGTPTLFLSLALTSSAGARASARIVGRNDGQTVLANNTGAALGFGISTVAPISITANCAYLTQEQELLIGIGKATGTDTVTLDALMVLLFQ